MYSLFKNLLIAILLIALPAFLTAQEDAEEETVKYTFTTDKQFNILSEVNGYTFVPNEIAEGEWEPDRIREGEVQIYISDRSIFFKGVDEYTKLGITSKQKFKMGYEYNWMDDKDPGINGVLRLIVDDKNFAQLIYVNSRQKPEYTFFLPVPNMNIFEKEKEYFSTKSTTKVRGYQALIGKKVLPYRMKEDVRNSDAEVKIDMEADPISITFYEDRIEYKTESLDKNYTIKKAKTFEYQHPGMPNVGFLLEITLKEINEPIRMYINTMNEIELMEVKYTQYTLFPD